MTSIGEITENCSSDSDDDLYTKSIELRNVIAVVNHCDNLHGVASVDNIVQKESTSKRGLVTHVDDDSDSLNLSETEDAFLTNCKESRQKRLERIEREKTLELERILLDPLVEVVLPNHKKSNSILSRRYNLRRRPGVVLDSLAPSRGKKNSTNRDSRKVEVIELGEEVDLRGRPGVVLHSLAPLRGKKNSTNKGVREVEVIELGEEVDLDSRDKDVIDFEKGVNLFVTLRSDQETGKPGRFMTIRQDEPFDSLRRIFAEELKCNQLDVLIHVNNVDAGPGDTPDSMGLDINKLAVVNVFCLKANPDLVQDLSTNPNFIPVKCIFAVGRPRCAYISLMESIYDAKRRIREQLKLPGAVNKLIFDSEVANDEETPQSIGMEAEDVIEVHLIS